MSCKFQLERDLNKVECIMLLKTIAMNNQGTLTSNDVDFPCSNSGVSTQMRGFIGGKFIFLKYKITAFVTHHRANLSELSFFY